jgi:hypothetical protein
VGPVVLTPAQTSDVGRSIRLVERRRLIPHAEAERVLRRAGYSPQRIEDLLRDLPDPIDTDRDHQKLVEHGISVGRLMDRMSSSP